MFTILGLRGQTNRNGALNSWLLWISTCEPFINSIIVSWTNKINPRFEGTVSLFVHASSIAIPMLLQVDGLFLYVFARPSLTRTLCESSSNWRKERIRSLACNIYPPSTSKWERELSWRKRFDCTASTHLSELFLRYFDTFMRSSARYIEWRGEQCDVYSEYPGVVYSVKNILWCVLYKHLRKSIA